MKTRMMRTTLRRAPLAALVAAGVAACSQADAKGEGGAAADAAAAAVTFDSARVISGATTVGAAPMFAVDGKGQKVVAWISAPNGGQDGRLYVSRVDGAGALDAPTELRDTLGPIEPHGEAPPKIAFSPSGSLYALWVVGKEVPGRRFPAGALRFARSEDAGKTWTAPASVTDAPELFGSFNFHALHAARGDTVYAAWLDGRTGKSRTFMTRSTDGGRTWAPNVRVDAAGDACPCCRTAIATAGGDTAFIAWRKIFPGNERVVVVARTTDGGKTWGEPVRAQKDGWVIDGCPHAGPSMQVDAQGRLHITWWSGKTGAAGVFYARSDDKGATFGEPVPVGVAEFSRPAHVQMVVDSNVVIAWDDGTVQTPRVAVRVSRDGGSTFAPAVMASAEGTTATFPVLASSNGKLSLAWAEDADPPKHDDHAAADKTKPKPLPSVGKKQIVMRTGTIGTN